MVLLNLCCCSVMSSWSPLVHLVDLSSGEVVVTSQGDVQEALIVTKVQVHLPNHKKMRFQQAAGAMLCCSLCKLTVY